MTCGKLHVEILEMWKNPEKCGKLLDCNSFVTIPIGA
jgi:hypothetical protein